MAAPIASPSAPSTGSGARSVGVAALALAGVLFGSTFFVVQDVLERAQVLPFLAVRFLIAAAVLAPLAWRRPATPGEVRHGVAAGLCLLAGFVLQTAGLRHTTAAASAFITYLLVVLVPLIAAVRTRRWPSRNVVVGVALAVAGLTALSGGAGGLGRGEVLTLACALGFALHIIVLGQVSARHDAVRLTFWQVLTVGLACLVPGAFAGSGAGAGYHFDGGVWGAAVFCGVGATAVAFWCMSWAQRVVPETQAAIILLLEPVSAGLLGELRGDHLGWRGGAGAGLILAAVVLAELVGRRPPALGGELALIPDDRSPDRADPGVPPAPG